MFCNAVPSLAAVPAPNQRLNLLGGKGVKGGMHGHTDRLILFFFPLKKQLSRDNSLVRNFSDYI